MSRSKWKGNFIDQAVLKVLQNTKKQLKIWSRRSVIPAFLIGSTVLVYNGKEFKKVTITKLVLNLENFAQLEDINQNLKNRIFICETF